MGKAVEICNACKSFGSLKANEDVCFDLNYGEVHALIGENGAGKTTLMRLLYGMYAPDNGIILVDGKPCVTSVKSSIRAGVGMVHQNFMQITHMSIVENIILGNVPRSRLGCVDYAKASEDIRTLATKLRMKVRPSQLLKDLSMGERQKIEIVKALYQGAKIFIFDEPTAVLTPRESRELFEIIQTLKDDGKAIIYISHKLNEVIAVADRTTVMRRGLVVGKWDSMQGVTREKLAAAMIGKAGFEMIESRHHTVGEQTVLSVDNLQYYDINEKKPLIRGISFSLRSGEILGIGGVEGNGQHELIRLIMGFARQNHGVIRLGGEDISRMDTHARRKKGLGYVSEDRINLGVSLSSTLQENYICGQESAPRFSRYGMLRRKVIDTEVTQIIEEYNIYGARLGASTKTLSGGNLQKLILARELSQKPDVLVVAHPTRGLDIGAINYVREQLLQAKTENTGILLVTADLEELLALSDRILVMYEGAFSGEISDPTNTSEEEIGLYMGGAVAQSGAEL